MITTAALLIGGVLCILSMLTHGRRGRKWGLLPQKQKPVAGTQK